MLVGELMTRLAEMPEDARVEFEYHLLIENEGWSDIDYKQEEVTTVELKTYSRGRGAKKTFHVVRLTGNV